MVSVLMCNNTHTPDDGPCETETCAVVEEGHEIRVVTTTNHMESSNEYCVCCVYISSDHTLKLY
jgi:hypothetical protein